MVHAQNAETNLHAEVPRAREAARRLTADFLPKVRASGGPISALVADGGGPALRSALVALTTPGGPMTLFSTSFVVATDREGRGIARDIANESDDRMRGMDLRTTFESVRKALVGQETLSDGELPAVGDVPSRVVLVAAVPLRNAQGEIVGSLAAGITYGTLARMIDGALRGGVGNSVFWTGIRVGERVLPSTGDRDVVARWLVPPVLIQKIPTAEAQRVASAGGEQYFHFAEGGRGWGGVVASLPALPNGQLVLFRSEASQR